MNSVERHMLVRRIQAVRVGALALVLVASAAYGQLDADALSAVRVCSSIQDDTARLACFDAALTMPEVEPAIVASPTVAPRLENSRADADADASDEAEDRTIRVVERRQNDFGVTTFIAENGETWVQRGGAAGRFPPVPFDAILQPGMGDTYFLLSPLGGRRARVLPVD